MKEVVKQISKILIGNPNGVNSKQVHGLISKNPNFKQLNLSLEKTKEILESVQGVDTLKP